jgi:hypothetical protein
MDNLGVWDVKPAIRTKNEILRGLQIVNANPAVKRNPKMTIGYEVVLSYSLMSHRSCVVWLISKLSIIIWESDLSLFTNRLIIIFIPNHLLSPTHSQIQYLVPLDRLWPRLRNERIPIEELEPPNCCCVKFVAPTTVPEEVCVVLFCSIRSCTSSSDKVMYLRRSAGDGLLAFSADVAGMGRESRDNLKIVSSTFWGSM